MGQEVSIGIIPYIKNIRVATFMGTSQEILDKIYLRDILLSPQ